MFFNIRMWDIRKHGKSNKAANYENHDTALKFPMYMYMLAVRGLNYGITKTKLWHYKGSHISACVPGQADGWYSLYAELSLWLS